MRYQIRLPGLKSPAAVTIRLPRSALVDCQATDSEATERRSGGKNSMLLASALHEFEELRRRRRI
jgi:hypothetical protein